jgi:hypothetical protein
MSLSEVLGVTTQKILLIAVSHLLVIVKSCFQHFWGKLDFEIALQLKVNWSRMERWLKCPTNSLIIQDLVSEVHSYWFNQMSAWWNLISHQHVHKLRHLVLSWASSVHFFIFCFPQVHVNIVCISHVSRDSSVGIATGYELDVLDSIPGKGKRFSLLHRVQTVSGIHLPPYPMGTGGCFPRE